MSSWRDLYQYLYWLNSILPANQLDFPVGDELLDTGVPGFKLKRQQLLIIPDHGLGPLHSFWGSTLLKFEPHPAIRGKSHIGSQIAFQAEKRVE